MDCLYGTDSLSRRKTVFYSSKYKIMILNFLKDYLLWDNFLSKWCHIGLTFFRMMEQTSQLLQPFVSFIIIFIS